MPRYKIIIEYDGTIYSGWQKQKNAITVQDQIESSLKNLTKKNIKIMGSGRTDAGVHAKGMISHVDIPGEIEAFKVMDGLNFHLKGIPISILKSEAVDDNFHARFSAKKRYYRYHIINRRAKLSLLRNKAWQIKETLDVVSMHEAAKILIGKHDFTTFRSVHCQSKSPQKTLEKLEVTRDGENIYIDTSAISYLHHQVRSMVGCLYYVGCGKWTKKNLENALRAKDRKALGYNAPPDGLYFMKVDY